MRRFLACAAVVAVAVRFLGCGRGEPDARAGKKENLPLVEVRQATREPIAEIAGVTGEVVATRLARLVSPAEGPIIACKVREGDRVTQGELLVSIGRTKAADASLAAAETELKRQEEEYKRVERLVKGGAIAAEELDEAGARLARARADRAKAMEESDDYRILSPWAGVASKVPVTEGDYVSPQSLVIELYDPGSLVVRFAVPEAWTSRVRVGTGCEVTFDAYPGRSFATKVGRLFGELNRDTRMLNVEVEIPDPVVLLPGMFARIALTLDAIQDAVVIPASAVTTDPAGGGIVFVVRDGTASLRAVTTGIEQEQRVQVVKGVEAGETVVVAGSERLRDGTRVRIRGDGEKPGRPRGAGEGAGG